MNISRISKNGEVEKYFNSLLENGLFDSTSLDRKKWRWKYAGNPSLSDGDLPSWACYIDNKIVGHLGAIPVGLKAGSRRIRAAWMVDFITSPLYRKKGMGHALVEDAGKNFDIMLTVGQTDMSYNLFMKMGWKLIGLVPYYIKIWDAGALIEEKVRNHFFANIIAKPINLFLSFLNYFMRLKHSENIDVSQIVSFDKEADLLWKEIAGSYEIIVPRNLAYLSWKFDVQPDMRYAKFKAVRNGKAAGYIITRTVKGNSSKPEGLIVDIIVRPEDSEVIDSLMAAALQHLKKEDCSVARFYINDKIIEKAVKNSGFIKRKPFMRFLISKKIDTLEDIEDLANWHLTAGDCDIDR